MRPISNDVRDSLLKEEPFVYAHLVKFEKPLKTDGGKSAQQAKDYVYITDGSVDIEFDDESLDVEGNSNGKQIYIANKLFKVGSVSETTEARAANINIDISAAALGVAFSDTITISTTQLTATKSFVEEGFREGDCVLLQRVGGSNDTAKVRINTFSNSNKTANITPLTKVVSGERIKITSLSSESALYSVTFDSPEVEGILTNRSETSYARYINRDVFIYKVHINPEDGTVIGMHPTNKTDGAYLLFKGIIAGGKLKEDPSKSSIMSWNITSHWGDFKRVSGRLTSDPHHRALDQTGVPDTGAVIRPAYATDLGFLHSETAVNLMAIYQVMETRYKSKRKGGLSGFLFGAEKTVSYEVEVDREVDLRFNLDAKYLPVVYGVNKIDSIPVFVDTLNTNSKKIFVAYALCEGEIGGLYDIYFDDTNSICLDANDSSTRSSQTSENTIDVLCQGRMDRGDTLTGNTINTTGSVFHGHSGGYDEGWSRRNFEIYGNSVVIPNDAASFSSGANGGAAGITHEKGTSFTTPIDTRIRFHAGKPNQRANPTLVRNASNFKVGTDYYSGTEQYWGSNHRLLDTAYVVAEYTIGEGETTIPSLDFVVRGKGIDCFDYDYSYAQDSVYAGSDAASSTFKLGETVTVKQTGTNTTIATLVIADIYTHTKMGGGTETRFRFKDASSLSPAFTAFYITNSSNGQFHFVRYNHTTVTGSVAKKLEEEITSQSTNSGGTSIDLTMSGIDSTMVEALKAGSVVSIADVSNFAANGEIYPRDYLHNYEFSYSGSGTTITDVGNSTQNASEVVNQFVTVKDAVALAAGASSTDDAYNGYIIEVTRRYADNTVKVQKRTITDYDGGQRVASVDEPWEEDAIPEANDTYKIFTTVAGDTRVSLNPAMQLLDYLKSKRYGRDLSDDDIDLPSFLEAARDCDTRSDVTMLTTAEATPDEIYAFSYGSKNLFVGTVKSSTAVSISGLGTRYNTVFTDVAGKIAHRWTNETYFFAGELYFHNGYLNQASSDGAISATPSATNYSSLSLTRITGSSGPSSLSVDVNSAARAYDGNPVVKTYNTTRANYGSGYSLYDSGDVKYWRYLGWEAKNQRHVTRHQTNTVVDTARPLFENLNSMLKQFNGILRYSNGKYSLAVKKAAAVPEQVTVDGVTYTIGAISDEDIIGGISVEDAGQKGTYNSVSVSVPDPQNLFESRSVTLFNSTYLKQDRMVPKKGDVRTPNISNYFNARINAKQYLDDSRAGLKINFTMAPSGLLLRAGDIIQLTYSRFGWTNKLYRIKNINFQENCLIQITAEEHNDSGYIIQPDFPVSAVPAETTAANVAAPAAPVLDDPATNKRGGVVLNWTNSSSFDPATYTVQIFRTADNPHGNDRTNSVLIGTSKGTQFTDPIVEPGANTFYYWIRYAVNIPQQRTSGVAPREIFSAYHPTSSTGGKPSTAAGTIDGMMISDVNDNASVICDPTGTPLNFNNTFTTLKVFIGGDPIKYDNTSPYGNNTFRVSNVTATNVTQGAVTAPSNGTNVAYNSANITAITSDTGSLEYTIIIKNALGEETTHQKLQTFTKVKNGAFGRTVELAASKYVINYSTAGTESDSITFTATARNFSGITPYFEFFVDGTSKQASATGSGTPPTKTFALADSDEPAIGGEKTILVQVREDSASGDIVAEDSVSIFGVQDGSDAITGFLTNEAHSVGSDFIGNVNLGSAGGTFKVFVGGTDVTTSCSFSVSSETGVDVSINSSTGVYTVNSFPDGNSSGNASLLATIPANLAPSGNNTVIGKVYTISRSRAAAPVFTNKLSNDSHSFTASTAGVVSSTDLAAGGGTFQVFKDGTNVNSNSAITFSKVSDTNITAAIDSNTGVYTISAFTASATTGSAVFRATVANTFSGTGASLTFDLEYTCSKANKGADGISGTGVAELTIYYQYSPYGSGGTASFPSTPSTGTFNFSTGVISSLPTGWSQSEPGTGTGTITVQSTTLATESSAGSGVSGTLSWNSPSFVRGAPGSTNFIFIYSSSQPSTPSATDVATNDGIPSGWSDGIPSNPNDGSKLWSSKGQASLSGNISTGAGLKLVYNWETPVVHVQVKNDISLGNVENVDQTDASNITSGSLAVGRGGTGETATNRFLNNQIGFGTLVDGEITISRGGYSSVTLSGLDNDFVGLDNVPNVNATNASNISSGSLAVGRGGTGETATNRFLNNQISLSTSGNAITVSRGGYSNQSITGLGQGLVGLSGVSNNADQTSANTSANTSNVGGRTASQIVDGRDRAVTGLNSSGVVQTTVPTAQGGTGETNTNRFLNNQISLSTSGNAITVSRGGYSNQSITGLGQGLVGLSGVSNNADQTSANTANNTSNVGARSAAQMVDGRDRAVTGLASNGDVNRAVPTGKGGTGQTNTNRFLNNQISLSTSGNAITVSRGGDSNQSITGLGQGLVGLSGVQNNADQTSANTAADTAAVGGTAAATVRNGAAAGATANQDSTSTIRGGISISSNGTLNGAGGGQVTASGLGANTDSTASIRGGITVGSVSSGAPFHSWTIIETDGTTNYNPSSTTASTTFQWRNGNGSLLKQKTITTTIDTSNKDLDVTYGADSGSGGGSVSMSPSSAPTSQTFRKIDLTYNSVTMSLTVSIINMTGWSFK